jgi:hypothetical protein
MADLDRSESSSLRGLSADPSLSFRNRLDASEDAAARSVEVDPWPTLLPSMRHSSVSRRSPHR